MDSKAQGAQSKRLIALDVFRGMTIALMILVNTPGSWSHVYPLLLHANWHGILPADFVFPFFLFIIGVSMAFSFSRYTGGQKALMLKILRRTAIIFLIGLALNYFPFYHKSLSDLRIMGVLQRIALAYGLAAIICIKIKERNLWKAGGLILLGYWVVLTGFGTDRPFSLEGNISKVIDNFIFGSGHLYGGFGIPFDPEGVLGTLSAAVSVISGYLIGLKIKASDDRNVLVKNLLLMGFSAMAAGLFWDLFFPINKPLWTSSYVIFTSGAACVCLGFLIEIIDIRGYAKWTGPFHVFGINPMILYVMSILLVKAMIYVIRWENDSSETVTMYSWLYHQVFVNISPGDMKFASLLFAFFVMLVCWCAGLFLYRKKIIFKV